MALPRALRVKKTLRLPVTHWMASAAFLNGHNAK
jgi:hypothetical protein